MLLFNINDNVWCLIILVNSEIIVKFEMTSNKVEIDFMITKLLEWNEKLGGSKGSIPTSIQKNPPPPHSSISYKRNSSASDTKSKSTRTSARKKESTPPTRTSVRASVTVSIKCDNSSANFNSSNGD
jgi:hypothetical protein